MNPPDLLPHLQRRTHVFQPQHLYLAEGFERPEGPNIGRNGEHLTIMFLSLNRSGLSERLCRSIVEHIPNFKGEILAIDNASTDEEFAKVSAMLESLPVRTRIVKMDQNYGVAGGRNRAMEHITTEWVMSLDNDIYFTTNPLPRWQEEIAQLGCRFFSLALYDPGQQSVFLRGGHLYVDLSEGEIYLGGGSCCPASDARESTGDPFLGTCMMGGASIYHADAFRRMGMYDDAMFIGFEDYEFSLRLFREGYKIGCSAIAALVHDHPKPETTVDTDYEKVRFKRDYIAESAAHFEQKHGMRVWNKGVDAWLAQRHKELGIEDASTPIAQPEDTPTASVSGKPRLLLVIDQSGWAFSNISDQIVRHLGDRYDTQIAPAAELDYFEHVMLLAHNSDITHFFWRPHIEHLFDGHAHNYARAIGLSGSADLLAPLFEKKITTAVYDHLFLDEESVRKYTPIYGRFVDGYYTSSAKLDAIYRQTYPTSPPLAVIPDGVDFDLFRKSDTPRLLGQGEELVLGWVGNSKWTSHVEDFKGYHSIIKPAIEELMAEGLKLREHLADRSLGYIPHALMPNYYSQVDVLLCASKIEGTPNPVLEAMASGVPVISTDVGIVPDAFGRKQREFIIARDKDSLKAAIRRLYANRGLLNELAAENLTSIEPWSWARRTDAFRLFFDMVQARPRGAHRPTEREAWFPAA